MQSTSKHERAEFSSVRKSVLFLGAVMVAYILYVVLSGQFEEFTASLAGVLAQEPPDPSPAAPVQLVVAGDLELDGAALS